MSDMMDRSLRPSFREAISRAERQVGYNEMKAARDDLEHQLRMDLIHDLCAIMAEIYMMDPARTVRISGEEMDVYMVQQVFKEIRRDQVVTVAAGFARLKDYVKNRKAYLRAMLYNSVFSVQADAVNDGNADVYFNSAHSGF